MVGRIDEAERTKNLLQRLQLAVHALNRACLHVEDVVDRDPVDPGLQLASKIELRQPRHHADQDFLGRVFCVLAVPQHAHSEAIDAPLQGLHETVESFSVPIDCPPGDIFERRALYHQCSISDFSVASSACNVARCASSAPSSSSSATGGAWRTKLQMQVPRVVSVTRD